MNIDDSKTIVTPEQVPITYTIAGVGTRFGAIMADTLLQCLAIAIIFFAFALISGTLSETFLDFDLGLSDWVTALLVLFFFLLVWGYFIFFETVWNGQTPGKRWCGIRVIRDTGHPIDFRTALIRNICRYVDFLPGFYGIGAFTMFFSKDSKRLGDYAAGTIVITDAPTRWINIETAPPPTDTPENSLQQNSPVPIPTPAMQPVRYQLLGDPRTVNIRALTREQYAVIDRFLVRRSELAEDVGQRLAQQIAVPLLALIGLNAPSTEGFPYGNLLEEIADAYRRQQIG